MYFRHEIGSSAEALAANWFQNNFTCTMIAKNFRTKAGEIDLIFEQPVENKSGSHEIELVFVEVRARLVSLAKYARPIVDGVESVDFRKLAKLHKTISIFLSSYNGKATTARLDILDWNGISWTHVPNIWNT